MAAVKLRKAGEDIVKLDKLDKETTTFLLDASDLLETLEIITSIDKVECTTDIVSKCRSRHGKLLEVVAIPIDLGTSTFAVHRVYVYCSTNLNNSKVFSFQVRSVK